MTSLDGIPQFADGMLRGLHLAPDLPVAITFRHHADGRLFHAAYQTTVPHRGAPRTEVYGVMVVPVAGPWGSASETWLPSWALDEYWFSEPPQRPTVAAALADG